jgi:hypothetical protein
VVKASLLLLDDVDGKIFSSFNTLVGPSRLDPGKHAFGRSMEMSQVEVYLRT